MKRKFSLLLALLLLFAMAMPSHSLAADTPAYYLFNGKSIARLETNSFTEAVSASYGNCLIVDGGTVSVSKNTDLSSCYLVLNNATLNIKKGSFYTYYPVLTGSAKINISSGAKYYIAGAYAYWPLAGSGSDFSLQLKSGTLSISNTGEKYALNMAQENKTAQTIDKYLKTENIPETFTLNGSAIVANSYSIYEGDIFVVNKSATLTVKSSFYTNGAKLTNYGTINLDGGVMDVSGSIPSNIQMPDITKYNLNKPEEIARYYNNLSNYINRVAKAMSARAGSKLDNYGAIKGNGSLNVYVNSQVTNYGSLKCDTVYNMGKVVNSSGSVDCLVMENLITSAKNSSTYVTTFYIFEGEIAYAVSAAKGKALGKISNKDMKGIIEILAPWYSDKQLSKAWNYQSSAGDADIVLYNGYF